MARLTSSQAPKQISSKDSRLKDRLWRINNLYYIIDKQGNKVKFKLNWAQLLLYDSMWFFNVLLKARQLGMTTVICILFLDAALFNKTTSCGIIAHNREDAEKFFDKKIKFAYENLPPEIKAMRPANTDSTRMYKFNNDSSISVGTSLRSDTLQFLHISEYGKICARFPEKAKEIRTGAINTVQSGNFVFIESTAEGNTGDFHNICQTALGRKRSGVKLSPLQFRFFFFPWWQHPEYLLASDEYEDETMPDELIEYFKDLEQEDGIKLSLSQKIWYRDKWEIQQDEMMREYPSTVEEAFAVPLRGAFYEMQIRRMIKERRLTKVAYDETLPVHTVWDLGISDNMVIVFFQIVGNAIHIIDFYTNTDKGFLHYRKYMDSLEYYYGQHFAPHDIGARQHTAKEEPEERIDIAAKAGINFEELPREMDIITGINRTRATFNRFWIDAEKCQRGDQSLFGALQLYRKEYNEKMMMFNEKPHKDWTCHFADPIRYLSMLIKLDMVSNVIYERGFNTDGSARNEYIQNRDKLAI
jgi:hypothetical protein